MKVIELPAKRLLIQANSGSIDGDLHRVDGISKDYPNLLKVPVIVNYANAVVFTKNYDFEVDGWQSLKKYRVGTLKGYKFAEKGTKSIPKVVRAAHFEQLINMLKLDRIDIAIGLELFQHSYSETIKKAGLKVLYPPIMKVEVFHYINKEHADLVPLLTRQLQQMASKGELEKIRTDYITRIIEQNN
ncbi:ABC transporter substrate-binding protein [Aliikangiella sp. G2MR2-5]|uniref:substrate-binding periplasmic protein n=1 Tax=Aliikangiella sp. G2MR2-5 TaxID=2788943 RepID=UPI0018AA2C37|nr:transporter substrate-binding domain-containing protein [Aliikangiella sp. G2MR2-5]